VCRRPAKDRKKARFQICVNSKDCPRINNFTAPSTSYIDAGKESPVARKCSLKAEMRLIPKKEFEAQKLQWIEKGAAATYERSNYHKRAPLKTTLPNRS
jgi:hypothetical protein